MIKKFYILFFTLLIGFNIAGAQSKVGTTAAAFLGISVGPRAVAMGSAFTAVANDASTLYYNPGGMARTHSSHVVFSHTQWLVDTNLTWIGGYYNIDGTNAIGFSAAQLDFGEQEVTTVSQPEGTGSYWGANDFAATLSYARNLTDRFSIGGNIKYIQQKLWNESASTFALDVGLLFITNFHDMRLGMSISNFGSDLRMDGKDLLYRVDLDPEKSGHNETIVSKLKTEDWPLPLFFRVGLALDVMQTELTRLTLAADAVRPSDNTEIINMGTEFGFNEMFFLRGGYKSLFRADSEEGLTLGVGVQLSTGPALDWQFDYTFLEFGAFEDIHMFAIGLTLK